MSPSAAVVWNLLAWGIALAWIAVIVIFTRAILKQKAITCTAEEVEQTELPELNVIVAAKNEADCIETCIRTLLAQDYPGLKVIAINDRSTDETPTILERLATEFADRLQVLHVRNLPAGWFGKPHALTQGVEVSSGSLICFTDADCKFLRADGFRLAVAELTKRNLDFMTIAAKYSMDSLREAVAVPCCAEAVLLWLHPERAEDPTWDEAFCNGSFLLAKRENFLNIGGWESVRTQICEDLQLMRLAKRSGNRVGVANAEGIYETASYATLKDSWNGWSRIFKGVLNSNQLAITLVRMCILFVLPLISVIAGSWQAVSTGSLAGLTEGAGLALTIAFCLRTVLDVAMFRVTSSPWYAVLLASLGRFYVMAAIGRALLSQWGLVSTHWRGASFVGGQLIMPQSAVTGDSRIPLLPASRVGGLPSRVSRPF